MNIIIRGDAFISLVAASAEVYRNESFGMILGHKRGKDFVVTECLPYQTAKRGYTSAYLDLKKQKLINQLLECMSKESVIGDYHSHPGLVLETLSDQDIIDMLRKKRDYISLLVSIRKVKRYKKWEVGKDGLSGTVGSFFIKIKAFSYDISKKEIRQEVVKCPYVENMKQNFCRINKSILKQVF
ncbi:MAG: Mov34/MPN/PAD-1 family protein [Nanoarchaeota archaeon]|nr:Mov34/MPN/PAD-1 family protein [Nanoarchaeota archaeon]